MLKLRPTTRSSTKQPNRTKNKSTQIKRIITTKHSLISTSHSHQQLSLTSQPHHHSQQSINTNLNKSSSSSSLSSTHSQPSSIHTQSKSTITYSEIRRQQDLNSAPDPPPPFLDPEQQVKLPEFNYITSSSFLKKWNKDSELFRQQLIYAHNPPNKQHQYLDHKQKENIIQQILQRNDPRPCIYVDTPEVLTIILSLLTTELGPIGVDLEFSADRAFLPTLELMQISTEFGMLAILDVVKLQHHFKPVIELLNKKEIILHGGSSDMMVLSNLQFQYDLPCKPIRVYDTQLIASFLGITPSPIGLGKLIFKQLQTAIPKGLGQSDWSTRPLSNQQIEYAFNDVRYLHILSNQLIDQVKSMPDIHVHINNDDNNSNNNTTSSNITFSTTNIGQQQPINNNINIKSNTTLKKYNRYELLLEELDLFTNTKRETPTPDDAWIEIVNNTSNFNELITDEIQLTTLKALAKWRQIQGYRRNQSPRFIIHNNVLLHLAQFQPTADEIRAQFGHIPYVRANADILRHLIDAVRTQQLKPIVDNMNIDENNNNGPNNNTITSQDGQKRMKNIQLQSIEQIVMQNVLSTIVCITALDATLTPDQLATHNELKEFVSTLFDYYNSIENSDSNNIGQNGKNDVNHNQQESIKMTSQGKPILDINNLPPRLMKYRFFHGFRKEIVGRKIISIINGNESISIQFSRNNIHQIDIQSHSVPMLNDLSISTM